MNSPAAITILAGGDSERMGRDKAVIEYGGEPLLVRIARRALSVADTVCIAGRDRPDGWPLDDVEFVPDELPDRGPLEGIRCALEHLRAPTAVVACDMPLLDADALGWLLATHLDWYRGAPDRRHGIAILRNGQIEPTFSVYHPAIYEMLELQIDSNRRSLRGLVDHGDFATRRLPDRLEDRLRNVNTPEQLAALPDNRS